MEDDDNNIDIINEEQKIYDSLSNEIKLNDDNNNNEIKSEDIKNNKNESKFLELQQKTFDLIQKSTKKKRNSALIRQLVSKDKHRFC